LEIDPEGGPGPTWTEEPVENRKYVTMCSFVHKYQSFAGTCRLHLNSLLRLRPRQPVPPTCVYLFPKPHRVTFHKDRRLHPYLYTSFAA